MSLKTLIDSILKEKHRSLSWLAVSMGKTFDGLRLSLINESIKYKDLLLMAKILEVPAKNFFEGNEEDFMAVPNLISESVHEYGDYRLSIKNYTELVSTLKDQINDKERIITLMSKAQN
ncbi:hypothetical protein [Pedobacter nyackensis]|uniref:HTH cro/C1-type domain-containing protein n=1 Tax=Pedobacter nyackensis TaxID=475255 RepID=A0A1W2EHY4_9SPHI|nr:hypothetical protein [Pedobacter nyackensis]SMD09319.1 hypothetical protein SAMN04488101_112115 [Pedobacter nyackensis]